MSVRADAESLRKIPLFRECEAVPLQVLAFAAERQKFDTGERLLTQGQHVPAAIFLLQGMAELRQDGQPVGRAEPGALLGEVAMLSSSTSSLTAVAEEPVMAVRIDKPLFQRVASEYPEFGQAVLKGLSERLGTSLRDLDGVRQMLTRAKGFSNL